jgi:hypothetical protein
MEGWEPLFLAWGPPCVGTNAQPPVNTNHNRQIRTTPPHWQHHKNPKRKQIMDSPLDDMHGYASTSTVEADEAPSSPPPIGWGTGGTQEEREARLAAADNPENVRPRVPWVQQDTFPDWDSANTARKTSKNAQWAYKYASGHSTGNTIMSCTHHIPRQYMYER